MRSGQSCVATIRTNSDRCSGDIHKTTTGCRSAILEVAKSTINRNCKNVNLFWSYPTDNLTINITSPFSGQQRAFKIDLDNDKIMGPISRVYRIIGNKPLDITTSAHRLIQRSYSKDEITLKFQAPSRMQYYGVYINYNIGRV